LLKSGTFLTGQELWRGRDNLLALRFYESHLDTLHSNIVSFVFNNIKHGIWNSDGTQILSMGYGTTAHGLGRPVDRFQAKKSCKFWIVLVT
jgi:hypothetical protein